MLILRDRPTSDFTAIALDQLPEAQVSERADGSGTIRFGQRSGLFGFGRAGFSAWAPALDPTPQFLAIPDARNVFDVVLRTAATAATAA